MSKTLALSAIEALPDHELLALCDLQLDGSQQAELSDLLARHQAAELSANDQHRLDEILADYRQGMVTKARAWRTAALRGLSADEVIAMLAMPQPAPDDAQCQQILEEELLRKYGR